VRAGALLAALLLAAGCAALRDPAGGGGPGPPDAGRALRAAEARLGAGAPLEAVRLLQEAAAGAPASPLLDRVLYRLGRVLVEAESPATDYRQAHRAFDRLVRERPASRYAPEARAWRALLEDYLARGQELERRARELERQAQELERRTRDLERLKSLDIEVEQPRRR
jgi:hypothetical protein